MSYLSDLLADPPDRKVCWPWPGRLRPDGRPSMVVSVDLAAAAGGALPLRRSEYAYRITYTLLRGPIPDGLTLDHLCGQRACVNPWHLEPVTAAENIRRYRGFGHVRQLPSGRWQASYQVGDSRRNGPITFTTRSDADAWLAGERVRRGQ